MDYITAKEAAALWGVSDRCVQLWCSRGKLPGAKNLGKQWILPSDSQRPLDNRTRMSKSALNMTPYHFPVFIHSKYFVYNSDLNDEEKIILNAQIGYLKGTYVDSIKQCRDVLKSTTSRHIRVGALVTIVFDSIMMGIYSSYKEATTQLEKLVNSETDHYEDFKLILAVIKYHITWDSGLLLDVNSNELSASALIHYHSVLIMDSIIKCVDESPQAISTYLAFCRFLDTEKYLPTSLMLRGLLASYYSKTGDLVSRNNNIKIACDIALSNNWLNYLAKYYIPISSGVDYYLSAVEPKAIDIVKAYTERNMRNFKQLIQMEIGSTRFSGISPRDTELLMLLSYDLTNKSIETVIGEPVGKQIKELQKRLNCSSRSELIKYAKSQLDTKKEKD